ncbi:MAG: hypothetical protein HYW57_02895 [Ignavibacteriales bacterium]|nr:hypothetical protein [Ignavibacteriales bacterium]
MSDETTGQRNSGMTMKNIKEEKVKGNENAKGKKKGFAFCSFPFYCCLIFSSCFFPD